MHTRALGLGIFAATVVCAAGCGSDNTFIVTDSFTPPSTGFDAPPDSLHDYAVGTLVGLDVRASKLFVDLNSVTVVSKNPDLVTIDDQSVKDSVLHVTLHALKAGTAAVDFLDDQKRPIEERVIQVKLPDEIDLSVDIDTDRGYTIPVIDTDNLLLAEKGEVTFRVAYKNKGKAVSGVGVLVGDSSILVVDNPTQAKPDREFIKLTAQPGPADVADVVLKIDDQVITTMHARIPSLDEVATIQLDQGVFPTLKNNGDIYTVWAKAFTKDAAPVFGAPFSWSFDSSALDGAADRVSYTYQSDEHRLFQVESGGAVNNLTVQAKLGTAAVSDDAKVGCSSSARAAPWFAGLAALLLVRKRRR
ncbi:MAG TPA: hypothetical protein VGO62_06665 [Myxococcota bacterium]